MTVRRLHFKAARSSDCPADAERNQTAAGQEGFSVLEAIVALAILGATVVPLLAWQAQMARETVAIERSLNSKIAESVALRYLQMLNPTGPTSGEQSLGGGWELEWTAEPLTPQAVLRAGLTEAGRHGAMLFSVQARLSSVRGGDVEFETTVMGIEELRPFEPF